LIVSVGVGGLLLAADFDHGVPKAEDDAAEYADDVNTEYLTAFLDMRDERQHDAGRS
jgi:hypothetical protein